MTENVEPRAGTADALRNVLRVQPQRPAAGCRLLGRHSADSGPETLGGDRLLERPPGRSYSTAAYSRPELLLLARPRQQGKTMVFFYC